MKRSFIGLLFGLVSLAMFGCGSDNNVVYWVPSSGSSGILVVSTVNGVPTQAVTASTVVTANALVVSSGALAPKDTPVTFTAGATQLGIGKTDANGFASVPFPTAGLKTGTVSITATTASYGSGTTQVKILGDGSTDPASLYFDPNNYQTQGIKNIPVTLNVYLKNAAGAAVSGQKITFSASAGILNPATAVSTDATGKASVTITGTTAGLYTVTATLDSVITTKNLVTIADSVTAPASLSLTAVTPLIKGTASTVIAAVVDLNGNPVAAGSTVAFTTTGGTLSAATAKTTADGTATVTLTNATSGTFVVTAKCPDSVNVVGKSVSVQFINNPADPTSITLSYVSPAKTGQNVIITAVVKNGQATPGPVADGTVVKFTTTGGTLTNPTTTVNGNATVTLTSASEGSFTVTGTVDSVSPAISGTVKVDVVQDPEKIKTVTLTADKSSVPADGTSAITVTADVKNNGGTAPPDGTVVTFTTTLGTPSGATTTVSGKATVKITSTTSGAATVTGATGGVSGNVPVTFTAYTKPIKAVLKLSTSGVVPNGKLIQALTCVVTTPVGITIPVGAGSVLSSAINVKIGILWDSNAGQVKENTLIVNPWNATTRSINMQIASAYIPDPVNNPTLSGLPAGDILTYTYDIPVGVAVPTVNDFALSGKFVGDSSAVAYPGMDIVSSLTYLY